MNKKGFPTEIWVGLGIFLFVVALVIFGVSYKLGGITNIAQFIIPNFNKTLDVSPGIAIVGIDLSKGYTNLTFYTGAKWVDVKNKELLIDGKKITKIEILNKLGVYFEDRIYGNGPYLVDYLSVNMASPKGSLPLDDNGVGLLSFIRKLFYSDDNDVRLYSSFTTLYPTPYVRVYNETPPLTFYVSSDDKDIFLFSMNEQQILEKSGRKKYSAKKLNELEPNSVFLSDPVYKKARELHLRWRDAILSGRECERHIELTYDENGNVTRKYRINKIDKMLFVDLNDYVKEGENEKYKEDCFIYNRSLRDFKIVDKNQFKIIFKQEMKEAGFLERFLERKRPKYFIPISSFVWIPHNEEKIIYNNEGYPLGICRGWCFSYESSPSQYTWPLDYHIKSNMKNTLNGVESFVMPLNVQQDFILGLNSILNSLAKSERVLHKNITIEYIEIESNRSYVLYNNIKKLKFEDIQSYIERLAKKYNSGLVIEN